MQIDFSAAFDRANHQGILYKLCSVGIGGSLLSILTQFLSNRNTLMAVVSSPGVRVTVEEFLIRDLGRVRMSGVTFGG